MSLKLITPINTRQFEKVPKASAFATTKGAVYMQSLTTGTLVIAGVSAVTSNQMWIASETLVSGDARVDVHGLVINPGDVFVMDCVNNSNAAHNGMRGIIDATGLLFTNTGTDVATGPFQQIDVVGAAADKKIKVRLAI